MPIGPIEDVVTVWVALGPSTAAHGAVEFIPGSRKQGQLPRMKTFAKKDILSYGQQLQGGATKGRMVDVKLQPGQRSMLHMHVIHGSGANNSGIGRLGISINYLTPDVMNYGLTPCPAKLPHNANKLTNFKTFYRPTS